MSVLFSVIIPHRNSLDKLPRIFSTIPDTEDIEIILIDNSTPPISKFDIPFHSRCILLYSPMELGAGGARNKGLDCAQGKWIIFADADDFFSKDAFFLFRRKQESNADIVFCSVDGVYLDTNEPADRADSYKKRIKSFLSGESDEFSLRFGWSVPWGKMIKRDLIEKHHIRFDEIVASNDIYFSTVVGYYASSIEVDNSILVYYVTVSKGTLTRRRDLDVIKSRLYAKLHCNQFLKEHGHSDKQWSVMFVFKECGHLGIKSFFVFMRMIFDFHQSPFVGMQRWFRSLQNSIKRDYRESKYIVR